MAINALNVYRTYYPDPPGGLQEAIKQICLSTAKSDVNNTVFTLSQKPTPKRVQRNEALVLRGRSWGAPASCDIGGLSSILDFRSAAEQSDILQYHFPWPFADFLHWITRQKKPAIMTYHSDIVRQRKVGYLYAPMMLRFLQRMDTIVATSPAYAETSQILTHPSICNKVEVIPLGIDETSYKQSYDEGIFNRIGIDSKQPYFLFVGVHRYYKGLQYLIEAAKGLQANIVISGSGPEEESLKALASEIQAENVFFTGYVSHAEKVALISNCLSLVLPSHLRSEAFGMVLVEAAMMHKPLISCEIGTGTSYVNVDGETGLVVKPGRPVDLLVAMQTLLNDTALASRMGQAARSRYEKLFSGEAMGKSYYELYKRLL